MKKIEPLKIKIGESDGVGLFHDSRGDVRRISQAINIMIEKQNEIIQTVNRLIDLQEK